MYFILFTECTIKGQVITECASHPNCTETCNNRNNPVACTQDCIPYGCECPNGTVVDEERNECVAPSGCPGKSSVHEFLKIFSSSKPQY